MNHRNAGKRLRDRVEDGSSSVGRSVVHGEDVRIRKELSDRVNESLDVPRLVVGGEKDEHPSVFGVGYHLGGITPVT
jgi:hypothetical protein